MNNEKINCLCGKIFNKHKFKNHYKKCSLFIQRFKELDMKISFLLDKYLYNKENIFLVRYMFERYIELIDRKINLKEKEISNIKSQNENTSRNNSIEERESFDINKINLNYNKTFDGIKENQITKKYYIYENILNIFSKINNNINDNSINLNINNNISNNIINNNKIKDNNVNKINFNNNININNENNFVKEIIEDQKNFYSSFPAPIQFDNNNNNYRKASIIKKLIEDKRHTIFFSGDNEIQLQIEKNFYINWRVIRNINSDTGYSVVKRFKSLLENERIKSDNLRIKFDEFYKDDTEIEKSKTNKNYKKK